MTYAEAQFFTGTKDGKPAFLDYATGESNLLPANKKKIHLNDIRTLNPQPTVLSHGFQRVDFPLTINEDAFLSPAESNSSTPNPISTYYRDCETLIARITGASTVVAFHHRHRQQQLNSPTSSIDKIKSYTTTPVPDIHIDNDLSTATAHLARILSPSEVQHWTSRHWAILNLWRPLVPVHQLPLALLDPSSTPIHPSSLTEPVYTRGNYKSHIRGLRWHPEYRFYYMSCMQEDEGVVFVDFDSGRGGRWGGVAHGAVEVVGEDKVTGGEGVTGEAGLRRSVEVRCLVLYD